MEQKLEEPVFWFLGP